MQFEVQVMSDEDYEDLIAEVSVDGEFVFLVSQEEGPDSLKVEIYPRQDGKPWTFAVTDLQEAVSKAAQRLWELRKA